MFTPAKSRPAHNDKKVDVTPPAARMEFVKLNPLKSPRETKTPIAAKQITAIRKKTAKRLFKRIILF